MHGFRPLARWYVLWEGGMQQHFVFPVVPEAEGLRYRATADGGGWATAGTLLCYHLESKSPSSSLSPRARGRSYSSASCKPEP